MLGKQNRKQQIVLGEQEKEMIKLQAIAKSLNDDNVKIRNNLQNISKTLKLTEKDALKSKNKCENLESTIEKLKTEKNALQKALKKLEKTKKQTRKDNSKATDTKDIKIVEANKVDIEHHDYEDLAYNIPVTSNPYKILEDEKAGHSELQR